MFEYDVHAALNYRTDAKNPQLILEFPKSAVLFLQGTKKIPDQLSCLIKFQDGTSHKYRVPTVKVQSYTLEEIKEKLRAFIQEKFEIDDDPDFTDDVHLFNEGFVDSFGAVEIIHFIEQTYNIEITQKDITLYPMNTIEEIAEVVENKLS